MPRFCTDPLKESIRRKRISEGVKKSWTEERRKAYGEKMRGRKHSEESKKKISEAKRMYWATHPKLIGEKNPFYGKTHSQKSIKTAVQNRRAKLEQILASRKEHHNMVRKRAEELAQKGATILFIDLPKFKRPDLIYLKDGIVTVEEMSRTSGLLKMEVLEGWNALDVSQNMLK